MTQDLDTLIRSMNASLHPEPVAICVRKGGTPLPMDAIIATIREAEGMTVVLHERDARAAGLTVVFRAEWITLNVQSDLSAVGLTAAFSRALADAGISCNVFAGVHHDHIFVAYGDGTRALNVLQTLSRNGHA